MYMINEIKKQSTDSANLYWEAILLEDLLKILENYEIKKISRKNTK